MDNVDVAKINASIYNLMQTYLANNNITITNFAKQIGVNTTTLTTIKQRKTSPNISTVAAIAAGMNMKIEDFIKGIKY